jgi:superfamily II DNA or RNA helicase
MVIHGVFAVLGGACGGTGPQDYVATESPQTNPVASDRGAFGGDFILLPVASTGSSLYGEDAVDHLEGVSETSLSRTKIRPDIRANTTKPNEIAEVLKENRRVVVFCTYQSSERIKDALYYLPGFSFDAAVMDEAHRTAGAGKVENSPWQMCLDDDHIGIDRRLFMTATPRVHKARKSAKDQRSFNNAEDLLEEFIDHGVSMDDESVYGKIVYEFSFAEAIGAGILSDYKIWAVAVSDSDIRTAARANNKVNLDRVDLQHPDPSQLEAVASARNLAVIAAVGKMAERGIISGMLSFHSDTMKS